MYFNRCQKLFSYCSLEFSSRSHSERKSEISALRGRITLLGSNITPVKVSFLTQFQIATNMGQRTYLLYKNR